MCKFKDAPEDVFFTKTTLFSGHERYMSTDMYLFGSSSSDLVEFKPGIFNYKFAYEIPSTLPTSVKSKFGTIRYRVEANLLTDWEYDVFSKVTFTVIRFEDLSYRSELMEPASDEIITSFCCWSCKTKPLIIRASIPFTGYVPKQNIRVTLRIDNRCGFDVYRTIISLKKVFTFISDHPVERSWSDAKTLLKTINEGAKNGRETKILAVIDVPAFTLPTNRLSRCVQVSYLLQITADVVGFVRSPKIKLPIVIGTKPLKFENKKLK